MEQQKLCKWLRDHSSGRYRPSAEAADLIERQQEAMAEASKIITELCQTFDIPLPAATLDRLKTQEDIAK